MKGNFALDGAYFGTSSSPGSKSYRFAHAEQRITNGSSVSAAVGSDHTCARLSDSTLRCWGVNAYGQLGDGTTSTQSTPVIVSNNLNNALGVATGGSQTGR